MKKEDEIHITIPYEKWEKIKKMIAERKEEPWYIIGYLMQTLENLKEK